MGGFSALGEAIVLGLASGPACIASCGPVVVPTLLAEGVGLGVNARYLVAFLGTRLLGYLAFAAAAWGLGRATMTDGAAHPRLLGVVHLLLASALLWHAWSSGRACRRSCADPTLLSVGRADRRGVPQAAILGFLTGIGLCPPFAAAGVRAAGLGSLGAAFLFFGAFFLGTCVWFLPLVGLGPVPRNDAVRTIARMTTVLIALYYFFVGSTWLLGGGAHVR